MDEHRSCDCTSLRVFSTEQPFSSFEHIETFYGNLFPSIQRLFSLARAQGARTLMMEDIPPKGIIHDENEEILSYFPDFVSEGLYRISFWTSRFAAPSKEHCQNDDCLGYAILKHDRVASKPYDRWHVFEAVFRKYDDPHNVIPNPMKYHVSLGGVDVVLEGLLYAQQNTLNKTCSQVALRSVLTRLVSSEVSYREINNKVRAVARTTFAPSDGLEIAEIRAVLSGFGVGFVDYEYAAHIPKERRRHPYQRFIYQGIESGAGALLAFHYTGPAARPNDRHIIPFYGHTFNKDTWAPDADLAYFRLGERVGYIPSEYWTSSFLGHDDNFGPNFCVPRLYVERRQVEYAAELLKPGIIISGVQAQALALQFLYSVLREMAKDPSASTNNWLRWLLVHAQRDIQRIILRAVPLNLDAYLHHISNQSDWEGHVEDKQLIDIFSKLLPKQLWIVELSIPQLFPANERKLGDIVLDGGKPLGSDISSCFSFVRIPNRYYLQYSRRKGKRDFLMVKSNLTSHVPVLNLY